LLVFWPVELVQYLCCKMGKENKKMKKPGMFWSLINLLKTFAEIGKVFNNMAQLFTVSVVISIGVGFSFLGAGKVDPSLGVSIVKVVCAICFGVNLGLFIPAALLQTEKFYDLTGSVTYLIAVSYSFRAGLDSSSDNTRKIIASSLTIVWALRLGSFLFLRVLRDGKDGRFDKIKINPFRFIVAWALQGLWVFLTAFGVYVANASSESPPIDGLDCVGIAVWVTGFAIEVISDRQKSSWRENPGNKGKFIEEGLWYYSRHPNMFGECILWTGQFILCSATFRGLQWSAVFSPVFVFLLIYFVSGVKMLEERADKKWGGSKNYENYKRTTSKFVILPKKKIKTV